MIVLSKDKKAPTSAVITANTALYLNFYDYSQQTSPYRHRAALVNWGGTRSFVATRPAGAPQDDIVSDEGGCRPLHSRL